MMWESCTICPSGDLCRSACLRECRPVCSINLCLYVFVCVFVCVCMFLYVCLCVCLCAHKLYIKLHQVEIQEREAKQDAVRCIALTALTIIWKWLIETRDWEQMQIQRLSKVIISMISFTFGGLGLFSLWLIGWDIHSAPLPFSHCKEAWYVALQMHYALWSICCQPGVNCFVLGCTGSTGITVLHWSALGC